jgi:flagellar biosynthesis protein FliR
VTVEFLSGHLLIAVRVLSVMLVAPLFASSLMPWIFRGLIAATVTLAVTLTSPVPDMPISPNNFGRLLMGEALLGLFIGGGIALLLSATGLVGTVLAQMVGLQWNRNGEESEEQQEPTARLLWGVSIAIYLLAQGPERLILAVCDSFMQIPVGSNVLGANTVAALTELLEQTAWLAVRGIGPAVVAYLIGVMFVGALGRVLPQFNLFFSGLNLNMVLFWGALVLTLSGGAWIMHEEIMDWLGNIQHVLAVANRGD